MRKTLVGLAALSALLLPLASRAQQSNPPPQNSSQNATPPPAPEQSVADAARLVKAQKAAQGQSTPATPRVFDNDNIPKNGGISAVGAQPPASTGDSDKNSGDDKSANGGSPKSGTPAGNDENSWRQLFKDLHHRLDQDQEDLDLSQRELGVDNVQFYTDPVKGMQQGLTRSDINDKTAKIDELKKKVEADKQAIWTRKTHSATRAAISAGRARHVPRWNPSYLSKTKPSSAPCCARRSSARAMPWMKRRTAIYRDRKSARAALSAGSFGSEASGKFRTRRAARSEGAKPTLPVILVTAYGSVEEAVTAMKEGAFDFIQKPVDLDHLKLLLERASRQQELLRENLLLREEYSARYGFPRIVGEHPAMKDAGQMAQRVAATDSTVLLLGESGTGKEVFARAIHHLSARAECPFVALNCAAIPEGLVENELFGHERGAYTGAGARKIGKLELAHRGTIFLDEIGDLPLAIQGKLLRVLEERRFERVGGTQEIEVNVRILTATNKDLRAAVADKTFREDLYFRIAAVPITIPPLRDRGDDVLLLAEHFLERFRREFRKPACTLTEDARARCRRYRVAGQRARTAEHHRTRGDSDERAEIDAAALQLPRPSRRGDEFPAGNAERSLLVGRPARRSFSARRGACGALQDSGSAAGIQVE